jgi:predicted aspartyl protease
MTPELPLTFRDQNAKEHEVNCQFLIDTGSTISSIPQQMNPLFMNDIYVNVETGAGTQKQHLTKIQVIIDEHIYNLIACVNQGSSCILGMDILKYYTLTIDGDKAGILVKNNIMPNVEEEFRI